MRNKTIKKIQMDIPTNYLDKFKYYPELTLFPLQWENLKEKRCAICGNKLRFPLKGKYAFCNGVKHLKPFLILKSKLN